MQYSERGEYDPISLLEKKRHSVAANKGYSVTALSDRYVALFRQDIFKICLMTKTKNRKKTLRGDKRGTGGHTYDYLELWKMTLYVTSLFIANNCTVSRGSKANVIGAMDYDIRLYLLFDNKFCCVSRKQGDCNKSYGL